jgi:glycerate kinase
MRVLIAPDSFKGSLTALAAAQAMERGVREVFPQAEIFKVPIADGGEGTVEALVAATSGAIRRTWVHGPLQTPVEAFWGILGDGQTAVIEMASASGLPLVPRDKRDPRLTSTYGTGELIKAALDAGLTRLIIGIGGSATNDGGTGMAQALGVRFLDAEGLELPPGGGALAQLAQIDLTNLDPRLATADLLVACDVDNPLTGPRGASAIYGPQKGATPDMVPVLDAALARFAEVATQATGRDVATLPGAGAAGGLGAGLLFFTPARLSPGVKIVLEATGFGELARTADLVITGEGCTDAQTAMGKAPVGVAAMAKTWGVPVLCLSGGLGIGAEDVLALGIDALMSIVPQAMPLEACMVEGAALTQAAAARACRMLKLGSRLHGVALDPAPPGPGLA